MDLEPLSMILVNGENHISNKLQILLSGDWITRHHLYKWKLMNDPSQIESFPYQQKRTWNSSLSDLLSLKSLWVTYGILMIQLGNIPDQKYSLGTTENISHNLILAIIPLSPIGWVAFIVGEGVGWIFEFVFYKLYAPNFNHSFSRS